MLARDTGSMYIIDLTHYLDDKGRITPERGPARKRSIS